MTNDSVVKFAKIAGAKVRFDKDYTSDLGPYWSDLAFVAGVEINEVQQILMESFWTVKRCHNDRIIISLSEHFSNTKKDHEDFLSRKFGEVKCYISSNEK